jgi:hypothetical protein
MKDKCPSHNAEPSSVYVLAAVTATTYHYIVNNMWDTYINTVEFLTLYKHSVCASARSLGGEYLVHGRNDT